VRSSLCKEESVKQLVYSPADGNVFIKEVPAPTVGSGCVLVQTGASLISAGTERLVIGFGQKNLLEKGRSRPELVQHVLDKVRREGVLTTIRAVRNRLDRPISLGYSSAGTIVEIGADVTDLKPGDRVACAGAGYAAHAEVVSIPRNLVAKVPEPRSSGAKRVDFEEAAFATLGAIAMHGMRLAEPQVGETIAVIGLGLIGQLTVQLAQVAGCTVLGMDPNRARCRLAEQLGCAGCAAEEGEFRSLIAAHAESVGADVVIIAAATPSQSPVRLAGEVARSRGRVVAIGAIGTEIPRNLYYQKELVFQISRSYGPGRYDNAYEEKGHDYPIEYVRWTENRNLKSFLDLLAQGQVHAQSLITHRFEIAEARQAYDLILGKAKEEFLGVIITYPPKVSFTHHIALNSSAPDTGRAVRADGCRVGLIGAGNFARVVLLPSIRREASTRLIGVCAATGLSAQHAGKKFGFRYCTADPSQILSDPDINTVVVATPHQLHAKQVLGALANGKNVFCEKPLCVSEGELAEIVQAYRNAKEPRPQLMVGFNRRFAPMALALKEFLSRRHEPFIMQYRVNAGPVPSNSWQQEKDHGGRIIGEVCHFVDFLTFLAEELPVRVDARGLCIRGAGPLDDNVVITLEFANGSLGTITYVANGDRSFPKERIEVFGGASVGVIDDFRRLELVRNGHRERAASRPWQDKGHRAEWQAFASGLKTQRQPIPFEQVLAATLVTFRILESLRRSEPIDVGLGDFVASCLEQSS
jgi:predicted dehydrogenase